MSELLPTDGDHAVELRQVSVFLENEPGRLAEVLRHLADARVNLLTMSLAETERFGIARMIVDDPDAAVAALSELGVTTQVVDVLAVEVPNRPGGLADIIELFARSGVNVRYVYAEMGGTAERAVLIMRLNPSAEALRLLVEAGIHD